MIPALQHLLESEQFTMPSGKTILLDTIIDANEVIFIMDLIRNHRLTSAVEIGCALGTSSMAIADALSEINNSAYHHIIIDPYQRSDWESVGIHHLQQAGYTRFELIEQGSEIALPELCKQGRSIDFAFIDGWHTFDHTLIDFFYLSRMLKPGGIIVIDDVHMPGINKAVRYIYNYDCYQYAGSVPHSDLSIKRKLLDLIRIIPNGLARIIGHRLAAELFSAESVHSNNALHLHSSMIAFKKVKEDDRPWNWFKPF